MKLKLEEHKLKLVSLATTYPESTSSATPKFVHSLNKALVKLGVEIKVITPHVKGFSTAQMMDGVTIKRFRYLPENLELNYSHQVYSQVLFHHQANAKQDVIIENENSF